jgi:DNA-binding transcriptional ArsR family regulator
MNIKPKYNDQDLINLAGFAKALAHPTRLFILKFLSCCESCYTGNIVDELPIAQSSVSQHLKILKEAGLIDGTIETPKVFYCINKKNWELAKKMFKDFF